MFITMKYDNDNTKMVWFDASEIDAFGTDSEETFVHLKSGLKFIVAESMITKLRSVMEGDLRKPFADSQPAKPVLASGREFI